jgi:hypothetical protein
MLEWRPRLVGWIVIVAVVGIALVNGLLGYGPMNWEW